MSPKGVVEGSGSVGFSLVNWAICGVIAMSGEYIWKYKYHMIAILRYLENYENKKSCKICHSN